VAFRSLLVSWQSLSKRKVWPDVGKTIFALTPLRVSRTKATQIASSVSGNASTISSIAPRFSLQYPTASSHAHQKNQGRLLLKWSCCKFFASQNPRWSSADRFPCVWSGVVHFRTAKPDLIR
jgi:hypothetical protein